MARKNFTQLPTPQEYQHILSRQTQRRLPCNKKYIHYPCFSSIVQLLKSFKISNHFFTHKFSSKDLFNTDLINYEIKLILEKTTKGILTKQHGYTKLYNQIYDYLSEEDKLQKTDLIFVPGAKTLARVNKAVELYKKGYSDLICISGRGPLYGQKYNEARTQKKYAVRKGIPVNKIITENNSVTLLDNVLSSINLLEKKKINYNSLLLVNSPYVARRSWSYFRKYLPDSIKIIRINSSTKKEFKRTNWYRNKKGIKVILNEFIKMRIDVILNNA